MGASTTEREDTSTRSASAASGNDTAEEVARDPFPHRTAAVIAIVLAVLVATTAGALALDWLPDLIDPAPRAAPDFTIQVQDNATFTLSEHRGDVVVLDLMAVDCPSCRITERSLMTLRATSPETVIVSVDIWTSLEDPAYLDAHMRAIGADWAYGMDTDGLLQKYDAFEISKVVVIDPDGHIAWSEVGGIREDPLAAAVASAWSDEASPGGVPALGLGVHGFAALAGVAAFFAPCAFPLLPGYMAYTVSLRGGRAGGGSAAGVDGHRLGVRRPAPWSQALVAGFVAALGVFSVYLVVGLVVSAFGGAVSRHVPLLQPLAGLAAIVLGTLLLAGVSMTRLVAPVQRSIDRLLALGRSRPATSEGDLSAFYSYGLGYGAASAACTAPIFLQVVITAFAIGTGAGLRVFLVYATAASALMVVATLLSLRAAVWLRGRAVLVSRVVMPVTGIIMVGAGVYLVGFYWQAFGSWA